jgi:thiol:disulfide interchange protein DsbD
MKKSILLLILLFTSFIALATTPPLGHDVFKLKAKILDPNTVSITLTIKDGFYLYKERIHAVAGSHTQLGPLRLPKATSKKDSEGHTYQIYRHQLQFSAALLNEKPGQTKLTVYYQGCSDGGFCYPPTQQSMMLTIDKSLSLTKLSLTQPKVKEIPKTRAIEVTQSSNIASLFANKNIFWLLIGFYGFGLLLAFTPCVLPMVPVLSGIIVGQHGKMTTRKAFFISLSYVLAMSFTYALAGLVIALAGQNLQATLQAPWAVGLFSLVFVLLAFAMFDFYELKLPDSWLNTLQGVSRKKGRGAYLSAAIMGVLSTLILSPCVTAPLVGALSYIAKTGDVIQGGLSLLFLGFGMGTPLMLVGVGAGRFIPKTGGWMNNVKHLFGVLMLMVAVYLAERILPAKITMALWALLLIIPSIYLGAFRETAKTNIAIICKGFGLMLFVYGVIILIGLAMGNTNPLEPLHQEDKISTTHKQPYFVAYDIETVNKIIKKANGKPVLLDFYADWCASCKVMEGTIFKNPTIQKVLRNMIWIKADVTQNSDQNLALEKLFDVVAPPTFIFISSDGEESVRIVGETDKATFLKALKNAM